MFFIVTRACAEFTGNIQHAVIAFLFFLLKLTCLAGWVWLWAGGDTFYNPPSFFHNTKLQPNQKSLDKLPAFIPVAGRSFGSLSLVCLFVCVLALLFFSPGCLFVCLVSGLGSAFHSGVPVWLVGF